MRAVRPIILSVNSCAICELKEKGVTLPEGKTAEDFVLTQYYLSNDPNKIPTPIDADLSQESGILLLNPETATEGKQFKPSVGGLFGTARSVFKALGFLPKDEPEPQSKEVSTKKRSSDGLYSDRIR